MAATIEMDFANHTYETGLADDWRLDVYVDKRGRYGDKMSRAEFKHIKNVFREIEDVTGIDIKLGFNKRAYKKSEMDILNVDPDGVRGNVIGYFDQTDWGSVLYYEDTGNYTTLSTITHEIGHAFGLGHPPGGGYDSNYTTYDTMMSYNDVGYVTFSPSDLDTLNYIWG